MKNKPRVVYWNNIPAPYLVERFNALTDRGNLDFEAWFNERCESDRSWDVDESKWQFPYRYMPALRVYSHRVRFPLPVLIDKPPDVLISLYAEPVFLIGWVIARLRGSRTMFRTLMTYDRWITRRWWKESLKRYIFSRVDGVETPGRNGRNFAMKYGVPEQRIFYVTHAIDVEHYKNGRETTLPERDIIREGLGLQGITYIYVGRLWWGKGLNYLLDAFRDLQRRLKGKASLLLVGDGKDEKALREKCRQEEIRNVVFAGFRQKQELPHYYTAADVFVFPTLGDPYGLVVDEAMACSLPIISTTEAGEICDRVDEGVNGFIVPPENCTVLSDRMERLAHDAELRIEMGRRSVEKIEGHTPEQWAEDFEYAVDEILRMQRR